MKTAWNVCSGFKHLTVIKLGQVDHCQQSVIIYKGHLPSASLGEFVGEVVFVFLIENMMNRSKTRFAKNRTILKQHR